MTPAKKSKLAFKPRRMWEDSGGGFWSYHKNARAASGGDHPQAIRVLPDDPESVEALVELAAIAGVEKLFPHEKWENLTEHRRKVERAMARTHLAALGFKPKAR